MTQNLSSDELYEYLNDCIISYQNLIMESENSYDEQLNRHYHNCYIKMKETVFGNYIFTKDKKQNANIHL